MMFKWEKFIFHMTKIAINIRVTEKIVSYYKKNKM